MYTDSKTRYVIANSLKELLESKRFEKITIKNIVEHCGLNRQTFYYYFQDKYELVNWIYDTEVDDYLIVPKSREDGYFNITVVIKRIYLNKAFYRKILTSDNSQDFRNHMLSQMRKHTRNLIEYNTRTGNADNALREFCIDYISYAYIGTIFRWIENDTGMSPETLSKFLFSLTDTSFFKIMDQLSGEKSKN